jgi:Reverse transcriptase (RNA-dependent DNA polymerase)
MAYKATSDPDTLYYHEAMRQDDKDEFLRAMEKEINTQVDYGVYTLIPRNAVPQGVKVLPAVWSLRRKRDIKTSEIKKYKARCNVDGSKMQYGVHYDRSYSPVISWTFVRLLLALVCSHN